MARVAFRHVTRQFGHDVVALRDFSLSIEDGEFVVLVGPSGCGKSTALRLLAGLETPGDGDILIDDRVVNQASPQQRNVAMVFQNYALYPHMSVRANLEFPLRMRRTPASLIRDKVMWIAGLLDLSALLERKPGQLSGGQRQRVAMGRALVRDPSVFLLDEPLSNLDARLRAQIRGEIARLQQQVGNTTLYVTHDQVEAMTLGHRVAVMNAGELQQAGTPEALYNEPQNIFVARFLGSPGMNIIASRLLPGGDDTLSVRVGGQQLGLAAADRPGIRDFSPYLDQSIYLGIRPEAFSAAPLPGWAGLRIAITAVEFLGHETLLYFRLPGGEEGAGEDVLVARLAGRHAGDNGDGMLYVDLAAIYLFSREGELIQ